MLDRNKGEIDRVLQVMPIKINKYGRTGTYGSWFNFYLCHFKAKIRIGNDVSSCSRPTPSAQRGARCHEHKPFRERNPVVIGPWASPS